MKLKGKIAVIPGGTSGIGEKIAMGFISEGATVITASRNENKISSMNEVFMKNGYKGECLQVDIAKHSEVEYLMEFVADKYGTIDIMLNSVGYFPITETKAITEKEWYEVININLNGAFWCAQYASKYMIEKKNGRIIFITSGQGIQGIPLMAHYSAAKGGVIALARALAAEWGCYNITVNTIAPGPTATTKITQNFPKAFLEKQAQIIALKRLGNPDDCTGLAILLASEEGAYITGTTIPVDGGIVNTIIS